MASARQPIPLPTMVFNSTYAPSVVDWRRRFTGPKSDAVVGSVSSKTVMLEKWFGIFRLRSPTFLWG